MSLTTIPLVKPYQKPGGSKQTQCWGDINCLWHSAPIGCTSLLHTITFIISFHGSSCSALLSSSVSLGLIDTAVYASDLCNCRPSEVPVALEHRQAYASFPRPSGNTCFKNIHSVTCKGNTEAKLPLQWAMSPVQYELHILNHSQAILKTKWSYKRHSLLWSNIVLKL